MQDTSSFQSEWQLMCQQLSDQLKDTSVMRWMSRVVPELTSDNKLNVWAPSACICELVQMRYSEAIRAWWQGKNPDSSIHIGIKKVENPPESAMAPQPIMLNKPLTFHGSDYDYGHEYGWSVIVNEIDTVKDI